MASPNPLQRTRHWNDQDEDVRPSAVAAPVAEQGTHPLLGARLAIADPAFQSRLSLTRFPYLTGHAVQGSVVLPAALVPYAGTDRLRPRA